MAARYTQDSVERVKDAMDMADIVGAKTELRRSGVNRLEGLCPFHDERTPSFGIDPVQKLFHCFGCGEGGSALDFVMKTEGVDFRTAIELMADRYGIELQVEDEDPMEASRRMRRERLLELLERTCAFYVRYLWESAEAGPAREYLLGRGLQEDALRRFRVGYAPSAWDKVYVASRRAGFSDEELLAVGLAKRGRDAGKLYDQFRRRITFPLCDLRGKVHGFGARAMGADQKPKYLNTPEGEVFHKRRQVYAADLARAAAAKAGAVVVCEGYTDVVALHQAGFENAVAMMGTSLTEEQVQLLTRLAPTAHLALDPDDAGKDAMLRAAVVAGNTGLNLRVIGLRDGLDPADLIAEKGREHVAEILGKSLPFGRFQILRLLETGDTRSAEGKEALLEEMAPVFQNLRELTDGRLQRVELIREISGRLDLPDDIVEGYLRRTGPAPGGAPQARAGAGAGAGAGGGRGVGRASRPPDERDDAAYAAADRHWDEDPGPEWSRFDGPSREIGGPRGGGTDLAALLARTEEVERRFLAFCLALPDIGADALEKVDPEQHFTSQLTRRAALHLRGRLGAPAEGLPDDDDALRALVTELSVRAAREPASPATLDAQRLQLELRRVDRRLHEIRAAGGTGAADLARHRETVQAEFDKAMELAVNSG